MRRLGKVPINVAGGWTDERIPRVSTELGIEFDDYFVRGIAGGASGNIYQQFLEHLESLRDMDHLAAGFVDQAAGLCRTDTASRVAKFSAIVEYRMMAE